MSLEGTQGMDNNKVSAYGAGVAVGGFGQVFRSIKIIT